MSERFEWRALPKADFAVIGDPVSHSLSPVMHNAAYSATGLEHRYVAVRVPLDEFDDAMEALGNAAFYGVNVTLPLKERASQWSEGGDSRMGAVNTIRLEDRQAINTDAPGFLRTLSELGVAPCQALVLGAGGSARAVCVALHDAGFKVAVYNRTKEKAERMISLSRCETVLLDQPDPAGCGLIVNATSAGIDGETPDLDWTHVEPSAVAYDLLYGQLPTPFLALAGSHGLRTVDGKGMLVAQGALSFEWWTGRAAPVQAMMQAIS